MSYASEVLLDSPYLYWRLDDPSGTVAEDASPNNRDGTYVNTPTLGAASLLSGEPGNAAVGFNGVDEYCRSNVVLNTTTVTIMVWFEYSGTPPGGPAFVCGFTDGVGSATNDKSIYIDSSGRPNAYAFDGGPKTATSPDALTAGKHFLVLRQDGSTIKIYVDGVEKASTGCGASFNGYSVNNIHVSGNTADKGYIAGTRDEFAVFTTSPTSARILELYNLGNGDETVSSSQTSSQSLLEPQETVASSQTSTQSLAQSVASELTNSQTNSQTIVEAYGITETISQSQIASYSLISRLRLPIVNIVDEGVDPGVYYISDGGSYLLDNLDRRTFIEVTSQDALDRDLTIQTSYTQDGLELDDRVVEIPAGEVAYVGPFPSYIYNFNITDIYIDAPDGNLKFRAFRLI